MARSTLSATRLWLIAFVVLAFVSGAHRASAAPLRVSPHTLGAYRTVQAAVDALPARGGTILIAPGRYRGQVRIGKPHVRLIGQGARPEDVTIVAGESAATSGSIYASATLHAAGDDFQARNLTIVNDWGSIAKQGASQAVALAISGDRAVAERVRILGRQDTLYLAHPPGLVTRQMFRDCYVEGHVDFIFGNGQTYFAGCTIHGVDHSTVMFTAQSRNAPAERDGFVFANCTFTAGRAPGGVYLGRPWRPYARVVLIDSRVDTPLATGGWREWKPGLTHDGTTATYAEYRTQFTQGAPAASRLRTLSDAEAGKYTLNSFFAGDTGWTRLGDAP